MDIVVSIAIWLPFFGFLVNGGISLLDPPKKEKYLRVVPWVGVGSIFLSFFLFILSYFLWKEKGTPYLITLFSWVEIGLLKIPFGYQLDKLSFFMAWIVTGVGALIHLYSVGYIEKKDWARYFSYLNFFIFAMLHLVLGRNLLVLFLGWEGVGLASYLLIGFEHEKEFPRYAGMKAFITNRIGDAGFLLGMFLLIKEVNTLEYVSLAGPLSKVSPDTLFWISLFLFIGAVGKSAQFPLYVWLPDAMAGPTPVSALIHAATMVTAGVFMIGRLSFLFLKAPYISLVIAWVAAFTALFSALMALTQTDIKKVLAYSTISQLGYMFLGMAVGAYPAGMFHLFTHAFFKALLFLSAGAVIIALHHEQDIRKMGGLFSSLKQIAIPFWIGALALAGIPPLAGFFSKDMLLEYVYRFPKTGEYLWYIGVITAFLTSFYSFRLMFLVFHGKPRKKYTHLEPISWHMKYPLYILAFCSIVAGFVGIPHVFTHKPPLIEEFFGKSFSLASLPEIPPGKVLFLMFLSVGMAVLGFLLSFYLYVKEGICPVADGAYRKPWVKWSYQKFYVDEIYEILLLKPIRNLMHKAYLYIDKKGIDSFVEGIPHFVRFLGEKMASFQTGRIPHYVFYLILLILFALYILQGGYV